MTYLIILFNAKGLYTYIFYLIETGITAVVVKQEDVFTLDNTKFVRISLHVMKSEKVVDFRTMKDIDLEALQTKVSNDARFTNTIQVGVNSVNSMQIK